MTITFLLYFVTLVVRLASLIKRSRKKNIRKYQKLVELVWSFTKSERRKATSKNFGIVSTWKKKKRKTSKFIDARINNWNERERN